MPAALERELERLYRLPLPEFTAARNDLAKRLRAEGKTEQADQVKALKKPSVAVWLANQLAHQDEVDVQRLLKAGATLTRTPARVAGGRSSDSFLEARREEQRALERLARVARSLAAQQGIGANAVERTMQTLRAASLTDEGRTQLKRGRLTEELEPPGFEALAGMTPARPLSKRAGAAKPKGGAAEARRRVQDAQREVRARAREAAQAESEAAQAESAAAEARRKARAARKRSDGAERALAEAEAALKKARN